MTDSQLTDHVNLNNTKDLQVNRMDVEDRMQRSALQLDHKRTSVTLEWNNIKYSLPVKDPNGGCCGAKIQKQILNGMNGIAKPGQLIAIMGPSGSGKTTMLNMLAGRIVSKKGSRLEGEIKINGVNRNSLGSKFARIAAFVQQDDGQDDVLFSLQTVRETLLTAARLRLPKDVSMVEKNKRVDAIISELGLTKCENTHIGDATTRGVSGGERKRTNIGVELIQDPALLFLDEPTSGLDSFQALNVIETLKVLCQSGTTVILSIHQPRSSIFALFDHMIILAEGNVVYDGEPGKTSVAYFGSLGFKCPDLFNPADYFLDVVSIDNTSPEEENKSRQRIQLLIKAAKQQRKKRKDNDDGISLQTLEQFEEVKIVRSGCCTQISVLGARNIRQLSRDKFALIIRIFMTVFCALFLSALYPLYSETIQDRTWIFFFVCTNLLFGGLFFVCNTVNTFILEKAIVMRERQAKSYFISSYYLTKVLTALPLGIITPLIFACIVYWIVGLNDDPFAFFAFCVITITGTLASIGLGFCIGSMHMAPTVDAASAMGPTLMVLLILFGGFYINRENIPDWIEWLSNIELLSLGQYGLWQCIGYLFLLLAVFHTIAFIVLRFNRTKYLDVTQYEIDENEQHSFTDTVITLNTTQYNLQLNQLKSASEYTEEEIDENP